MIKKLISLEEHEKEFWKRHNLTKAGASVPCGIACPRCNDELLADTTITLTSNPSQTPVYCSKCKWKGSIH